ncbi:MAG: PQQ-dependent sugar dehydrogenase [Chloroflexota bacterium]
MLLLSVGLLAACAIPDEPDPTATPEPTQTPLAEATSAPAIRTEPVGAGFTLPVSITHAGDERLFVAQRNGVIHVMQPDGTSSVFLDLSEQVTDDQAETGFFSIAFHPDYLDPAAPNSGQFFVTYTGKVDEVVNTFLSRFTVSDDPNVADPDSETWLLQIEQKQPVHKGGGLDFDKTTADLFVGIGDDWQPWTSQDPDALNGKVLRLSVSDIPADLTGDATALITPEVWAMGLRNPWRVEVDEAGDQILCR